MNQLWVYLPAALVAGELSLHLPFVQLAGRVFSHQRRAFAIMGDAHLDDEAKSAEILHHARRALGYSLLLCVATLSLVVPFFAACLLGPRSFESELVALAEVSMSVSLTVFTLAYVVLRLVLRR